jgi:hypothetical protein
VTASAAQADAFYREALEAATVWTVRDASGIPAPENGDGHRAMPFWSRESRAERVVATVAAYSGFATQSVPLAEWRQRWLPGLIKDGLMVGLNWSGASATGYDLHPTEVEANLAARE